VGYGVKTYYGVRESPNAILLPLQEHRDVCPAMRMDIRFRFLLGLIALSFSIGVYDTLLGYEPIT